MTNIYEPKSAIIQSIRRETPDIQTFTVVFEDEAERQSFKYEPGQFMELSILGVGEAPISITSSPSRPGFFEFSVKEVGCFTKALHKMKPGDKLGLRGPYGNGFPYAPYKGRNILFIGGGIGLAPLRSLINFMFDNRADYGSISILYGARSPQDLVFTDELENWAKLPNATVIHTVDRAQEGYEGRVGLVTTLLPLIEITPENTTAYVCGPPVAIPFIVKELLKLGFAEDQVISTLENYMKCGVGKCGHCEVGGKYMCTEGPVFTYKDMKELGFG